MPIELGPKSPGTARAVGAVDPWAARPVASQAGDSSKRVARSVGPVERSDALNPGPAPIDADRVAVIRKAIEQGTYPVLPAKIADAVIAAGILLKSAK
jgi:negative regulator of flagellin synthesis FlgM